MFELNQHEHLVRVFCSETIASDKMSYQDGKIFPPEAIKIFEGIHNYL